VLPILIKKKFLGFDELMNCRRVSYQLKTAVDNELGPPNKHSWGKCLWSFPYRFANVQMVSTFLVHFSASTSNPFIGKRIAVEIHSPEVFPTFIGMFEQYGHFLEVADINFETCTVRRLSSELPQILKHLPNLTSLDMSMTGLWNGDNGLRERWENNAEEPNDYYLLKGLKDWFYEGPLPHVEIPVCSQLTELYMPYPDDNLTPKQKQFQSGFFKSLFDAYGSQLTKLECTYYTFCDVIGEDTLTSIKPSSLKHLRITHWPDVSCTMPREGVSTIKYPYYYRFTLGIGKVLNQFSSCLETLAFEFIHEQTIDDTYSQFDKTVVYPEMKLLTAYLTNLFSPMWEIFKFQFVNLEVLRFEVDWLMWGRTDNTTADDLKRFFVIFPKLKKILMSWPSWFQREDRVFKKIDVI